MQEYYKMLEYINNLMESEDIKSSSEIISLSDLINAVEHDKEEYYDALDSFNTKLKRRTMFGKYKFNGIVYISYHINKIEVKLEFEDRFTSRNRKKEITIHKERNNEFSSSFENIQICNIINKNADLFNELFSELEFTNIAVIGNTYSITDDAKTFNLILNHYGTSLYDLYDYSIDLLDTKASKIYKKKYRNQLSIEQIVQNNKELLARKIPIKVSDLTDEIKSMVEFYLSQNCQMKMKLK